MPKYCHFQRIVPNLQKKYIELKNSCTRYLFKYIFGRMVYDWNKNSGLISIFSFYPSPHIKGSLCIFLIFFPSEYDFKMHFDNIFDQGPGSVHNYISLPT